MDTPSFNPKFTFDIGITHLDPVDQQAVIEMRRVCGEHRKLIERMVLNAKEEAIKRALTALGWTAPEGDGWESMDAAPKDGTRILLLHTPEGFPDGTQIVEGFWQVDSLDKVGRWKPWLGSRRRTTTETIEPTHWRIKPMPPKI